MLLTFSRLPNEYIISFIPQYRNTNKTQKKNHQIRSHFLIVSCLPNKYVISFIPQYRNTDKTQKKIIKSDQIERRRKRERRLGLTRGEIAWWRRRRDRRGASRDHDRRFARSRSARCFARSRSARCFVRSRSARRRDHDRRCDLSPFTRSRDRSFPLSFSLCASVSSSLYVFQFWKPFEVKIGTEMNFRGQSFFFTVK